MQESVAELKVLIPSFMKERLYAGAPTRRLLVVNLVSNHEKIEALYAKALEGFGYEIHVLTTFTLTKKLIFGVFGIEKLHFINDFERQIPLEKMTEEAIFLLGQVKPDEILALEKNGYHVGQCAVSSFVRKRRARAFALNTFEDRQAFVKELAAALRAAAYMENVMATIRPDLVLAVERGYTPLGQIYDACFKRGIPVISRNAAHKNGHEMVKCFKNSDMRFVHPYSISEKNWEALKRMPWTQEKWDALYREFAMHYGNGQWFGEVGTQINKVMVSPEELKARLLLTEGRKVVGVFPHLFWDATFFWGKDLFRDYYEWFRDVLLIAAKKTEVDWIVKIHPSNLIKSRRDGHDGDYEEMKVMHEVFGKKLPPHVQVITPSDPLSTFSLWRVLDYCLTVRGTVGLEAACFGVRTLTAGTGRYDRLGFTQDFETQEGYQEALLNIEKMPAMQPREKELARRFAYGLFLLRPLPMDILDMGFRQDDKASLYFQPKFTTRAEFENSEFVQKWRAFVLSGDEDFLREEIPTVVPQIQSAGI